MSTDRCHETEAIDTGLAALTFNRELRGFGIAAKEFVQGSEILLDKLVEI